MLGTELRGRVVKGRLKEAANARMKKGGREYANKKPTS